MSNAKIAEALVLINREIASEEERRQTLLAEAATVGKSIEDMQKAAQSLEALIGDSVAERQPARRGRRPARKTGKTPSGKGRGRKATGKTAGGYDRVAPAKVLAKIAKSGQSGVKRSVLSGRLANRKGNEPTRKALDDALQSLLSEMSIRREGYRFVAVGEPAPEAVQAESETPSDDGMTSIVENSATGSDESQEPEAAQSESDSIPFEEDPAAGETEESKSTASLAPSGSGRRGRPRKAVSAEVAQAMGEVAGVIVRAGETGCKMSAIRAGVEQVTGVSLSSADAKRAVKDLLQEGRVRRDKYRYVAN
ncbi:MAG: hypothetical protein OXI95_04400 [bacterium]|nr:hypothetical protein [bacterium]